MRPSIDETMLDVAKVLARRGTCLKRKVGVVITDFNGNILSAGYNGAPRGKQHCDEYSPCPAFVDSTLSCSAIHAEVNALIRCPDITKAHIIYITEKPCAKYQMLIDNTKIARVVYPDMEIPDGTT